MTKIELRIAYRQNSRSCSYTKKDWERLVLPLIQSMDHEETFRGSAVGVLKYTISGTDEQLRQFRTTLTTKMRLLDKKASYGWSIL